MFTPDVIIQLAGGATVIGYMHVQLREISRNLTTMTKQVAGLYSQAQTDKMIDLKLEPVKVDVSNLKSDVNGLKLEAQRGKK